MYIGYLNKDGKILTRDAKDIGAVQSPLYEVTICDAKGYLIPRLDEKIISENISFKFWVHLLHKHSADILLDDRAGKGTIYITNMRVVFVRTPKMYVRHEMMSAFGMASEVANILKQKSLRKSELKEYCEIPLDEIINLTTFIKNDKRYGTISILSKTGRTYLCGDLSQSEIDVLDTILKHTLVKTETKGLFSKKTMYWYVDPEKIKNLKRKPGKVGI
ncbi:MAG: hypothetical protein QMC80_07890 [Thermoplasmatales archaeon]|nr:hypothetical protein [Thermoplasmatales archaeon]